MMAASKTPTGTPTPKPTFAAVVIPVEDAVLLALAALNVADALAVESSANGRVEVAEVVTFRAVAESVKTLRS